MSAMEKLEITIGHPFEHEWDVDYDIYSEDKIDATIPFVIKKNDQTILELLFNYGLIIARFNDSKKTKIIASIYETDILEEGSYTYEYSPVTYSGKLITKISGEINVSSEKSDTIPIIRRGVRPWDLLRSKKPGEAGERASEEKQAERMSICEGCPRFVKLTSQCLECGCIMKLKTKLEAATCPLGKW